VKNDGSTPKPRVWAIAIGLYPTNYSERMQNIGEQQFFRYAPPIYSWIFIAVNTIQYRRNLSLGLDSAEINKKTLEAEQCIGVKTRRTYAVFKWLGLCLNHFVVLLSFTSYFLIVFNVRRSFMNGITLLIILWLFTIYLARGLSRLIKYWRVLTWYQAIVLTMQLVS